MRVRELRTNRLIVETSEIQDHKGDTLLATAGTVTANKAVVVDGNKDISAFRNLNAVNIDAGTSGTAGTVDVFPATATKGKLAITKANNAADTTTTLTVAEQAAARTITIPDPGANASLVHTGVTAQTLTGAVTVEGVATVGKTGAAGTLDLVAPTAANGKLRILAVNTGANYTLTLQNAAIGANRAVTIPDPGGDANFVMTAGNQEIAGNKTLTGETSIGKSGTAGVLDVFPATGSMGKLAITKADNAADTTTTLTVAAQAAVRTITIPDPGADASLVHTGVTAQTLTGAVTVEGTVTGGKVGAAGTLDLVAPTAVNGKLRILAVDTGADYTLTLQNTTLGASRTVTIPDPGNNANLVLSEGAATVNGVKTFGDAPVMSGASVSANTIPLASLVNGTGLSVLGVTGNAAAANANIVGTAGQILRVEGAALGFGDISGANITADTIPSSALVNGAGIAAMVAAGLGTSVSYIKTDDGTKTLLAANATKNRGCLVVVTVTEAFATGDTSQLILQLGEADTVEKCAASAVFTDAALGKVFVFGFLNTSTKAILATLVAAAGTGTGAVSITVLALPES